MTPLSVYEIWVESEFSASLRVADHSLFLDGFDERDFEEGL